MSVWYLIMFGTWPKPNPSFVFFLCQHVLALFSFYSNQYSVWLCLYDLTLMLSETSKNYWQQSQGNRCQTLWVKFLTQVLQFSNFVTYIVILRNNFQPFPATKMSHQNVSSKCLNKLPHANVSSKCLIKISNQNGSKIFIKMSHQISLKMFHENVSWKWLIKTLMKMSHENVS